MKLNINRIMKSTKHFVVKHSPEILTGIGVAGMVSAAVMAVKATPKALYLLDREEEERIDVLLTDDPNMSLEDAHAIAELKPVEKIQTAWKAYIPALVTGALSIVCIIGASRVNTKRNAALATAYSLSESALKEYQTKVIEAVGEEKASEITEQVHKELIDKAIKDDEAAYRKASKDWQNKEVIPDSDEVLCYDVCSGRQFKSSKYTLQSAENEINKIMRDEMYASLNEFYYLIGLKSTSMGDILGWNMDDGYLNLSLSSNVTEDGKPCLVVDYNIAPRYDYENLL